jgi:hypothetical protein
LATTLAADAAAAVITMDLARDKLWLAPLRQDLQP